MKGVNHKKCVNRIIFNGMCKASKLISTVVTGKISEVITSGMISLNTTPSTAYLNILFRSQILIDFFKNSVIIRLLFPHKAFLADNSTTRFRDLRVVLLLDLLFSINKCPVNNCLSYEIKMKYTYQTRFSSS